jgi:hypothetical protein
MTAPELSGARVIRLALSQHAQRDPVLALREVMLQLPEASELPAGSCVAITSELQSAPGRGLLGRLARMGPRAEAHRATCCTCLLAKGYVRLGAGKDASGVDFSWGYVPGEAGG